MRNAIKISNWILVKKLVSVQVCILLVKIFQASKMIRIRITYSVPVSDPAWIWIPFASIIFYDIGGEFALQQICRYKLGFSLFPGAEAIYHHWFLTRPKYLVTSFQDNITVFCPKGADPPPPPSFFQGAAKIGSNHLRTSKIAPPPSYWNRRVT